jgi:hypothetical protein
MNCPYCQKIMFRRLAEAHAECECGSIAIPPQRQAQSLGSMLNGIAKRHGVAFNGSSLSGGIAIAKAVEGIGDAVKALGAVLKGGGDGVRGAGHARIQPKKKARGN